MLYLCMQHLYVRENVLGTIVNVNSEWIHTVDIEICTNQRDPIDLVGIRTDVCVTTDS